MDAVASEISLVERSSRCAIHIFTQTRFLEVTITMYQRGDSFHVMCVFYSYCFNKFWRNSVRNKHFCTLMGFLFQISKIIIVCPIFGIY